VPRQDFHRFLGHVDDDLRGRFLLKRLDQTEDLGRSRTEVLEEDRQITVPVQVSDIERVLFPSRTGSDPLAGPEFSNRGSW
jgi:hypothetical protein